MAASDTPAEPPLTKARSTAQKQSSIRASGSQQQGRSSRRHSSGISDAGQLANNSPLPGRSVQSLDTPSSAVSIEDQLARVQTFCVYASELVDAQREDINKVSAAVKRIETELKSFKEFLGEMREERRATPREQKSNGITPEEIDLLTSSMGEIGRKANEVDALKLELAMMKGKIKRLENSLQQPQQTSIQPHASTDSEPAQASRSHSTYSFGERGQAHGGGAQEHRAKRGVPASVPNPPEVGEERIVYGGMSKGKNKRHRSPPGEATTRRRDDSSHRILNPLVEASHSSPVSLRPRRPEQLRPYLAATALFGENDDDDGAAPGHSSEDSLSHQPSRGRVGRAGVGPSSRGRALPTRPPRRSLPNPVEALFEEQDDLDVENTNGHRISSAATDRIQSPRIKQEEAPKQTTSKSSMLPLNQKKENVKLTKYGKTDMRDHRSRPVKRRKQEQDSSPDQGEDRNQDEAIRARERALDKEWEREYGSRDRG